MAHLKLLVVVSRGASNRWSVQSLLIPQHIFSHVITPLLIFAYLLQFTAFKCVKKKKDKFNLKGKGASSHFWRGVEETMKEKHNDKTKTQVSFSHMN